MPEVYIPETGDEWEALRKSDYSAFERAAAADKARQADNEHSRSSVENAVKDAIAVAHQPNLERNLRGLSIVEKQIALAEVERIAKHAAAEVCRTELADQVRGLNDSFLAVLRAINGYGLPELRGQMQSLMKAMEVMGNELTCQKNEQSAQRREMADLSKDGLAKVASAIVRG